MVEVQWVLGVAVPAQRADVQILQTELEQVELESEKNKNSSLKT